MKQPLQNGFFKFVFAGLAIILLNAFSSNLAFSQAPQLLNYQGVARDASGNPIPNNTLVSTDFKIHDNTVNGPVVYEETDTARVNQFGLFTMKIGSGTQIGSNQFNQINWGSGNKYLEVGFDPNGGSAFIPMGSTQLVSVPYALYAENGNWNKVFNDITNGNSGNVDIGGFSSANFGAKLNITTSSSPGIQIYDSTGAAINDHAYTMLVDRFGNTNSDGTAMYVKSDQTGMILKADSIGLEVYGKQFGVYSHDTSGIPYYGLTLNHTVGLFHNESLNFPTIVLENNSGGPAFTTTSYGTISNGGFVPNPEMLNVGGNLKLFGGTNSMTAPVGGAGTIRYNPTTNTFEGWNGSGWTPFGLGSSSTGLTSVNHDGTLNGDGTSGNPLKITNGTTLNDVLKWNGTNWISSPATGFTLPYTSGSLNTLATLFSLINTNSTGNAMNISGKSSFSRNGTTFNATTTLDIDGELRLRDQQNQYAPTALAGVIRFNQGVFSGYDGSQWINFGAGGVGDNWGTQVVQTSNQFSGNGTSGSPLTLAQNGATSNQVLSWNGSAWVPATVSGGGGGYWSANGNDIYNNNTGKLLFGLSASSGNGNIQFKTNAPSFGLGAKIWSNQSYATTLYVADSSLSGGTIGCAACGGNNALNAYSKYGTAIFAHSPSGDGLFAYSGAGNAIMVDGSVKDAGIKLAIRTPTMATNTSTYQVPATFSANQNDVIVITAITNGTFNTQSYELVWDQMNFVWYIVTNDGSPFISNLTFNLIKISK